MTEQQHLDILGDKLYSELIDAIRNQNKYIMQNNISETLAIRKIASVLKKTTTNFIRSASF